MIWTRCCRPAAPIQVFVQRLFRVLFLPPPLRAMGPEFLTISFDIILSGRIYVIHNRKPTAGERRHFVPGSFTVNIRPLYRNIIHYQAWKGGTESSLSPQLLKCEKKGTKLVKTYYRTSYQACTSTIGLYSSQYSPRTPLFLPLTPKNESLWKNKL
jgi:hypothetical protein